MTSCLVAILRTFKKKRNGDKSRNRRVFRPLANSSSSFFRFKLSYAFFSRPFFCVRGLKRFFCLLVRVFLMVLVIIVCHGTIISPNSFNTVVIMAAGISSETTIIPLSPRYKPSKCRLNCIRY
jgi:hypothetical protein